MILRHKVSESKNIVLKDLDEWDAFAAANEAALIEEHGYVYTALCHAWDDEGGLVFEEYHVFFDENFHLYNETILT